MSNDESENPYALEDPEEGPLVAIRDWIVFEGDRLVLATALSVVFFAFFFGLERVGVISFANANSITRLAGGMVAGTFSLVTMVVSINQLILSREFTAVGEARNRLEGVMDLRREVEADTGVPTSPADPVKLLTLLVETIDDDAATLAERAAGHGNEEFETSVEEYAEYVRGHTDRISRDMQSGRNRTFDALSASITYDDAWQIYLARRLKNHYEDELDEEHLAAFDDLTDSLERFNAVREQFKTVYLQRELTRFSQLTLSCGVPAILSALLIGFLYGDLGGPSIAVDHIPLVASVLLAIVVSPLALLASYVLRTSTIAHRTASTGPMLPGEDVDDRPIEP